MRNLRNLALIVLTFSLAACASIPVTRVSVQSFELKKQGIASNVAMAKVLDVLVDRGFDVKMTNADSGIVTTEYKKFATVGNDPPFDYYMQVKARIRIANDLTTVSLIPAVKEQNRLNVAAYTEHELEYFEGDPESVSEIASMQATVGWRVLAQTMFMNVVTETATAFGLSREDVVPNVSKTAANARAVED
jgi:hypothetical protein